VLRVIVSPVLHGDFAAIHASVSVFSTSRLQGDFYMTFRTHFHVRPFVRLGTLHLIPSTFRDEGRAFSRNCVVCRTLGRQISHGTFVDFGKLLCLVFPIEAPNAIFQSLVVRKGACVILYWLCVAIQIDFRSLRFAVLDDRRMAFWDVAIASSVNGHLLLAFILAPCKFRIGTRLLFKFPSVALDAFVLVFRIAHVRIFDVFLCHDVAIVTSWLLRQALFLAFTNANTLLGGAAFRRFRALELAFIVARRRLYFVFHGLVVPVIAALALLFAAFFDETLGRLFVFALYLFERVTRDFTGFVRAAIFRLTALAHRLEGTATYILLLLDFTRHALMDLVLGRDQIIDPLKTFNALFGFFFTPEITQSLF